jgi:hypothetical protein
MAETPLTGYKGGYKYQRTTPYSYRLDSKFKRLHAALPFLNVVDGVVTVEIGYAWDGVSGPTIDRPTTMRAGLKHDMAYQLMRNGILPQSYRIIADKQLKQDMKNDGAWWLTRQVYYYTLRAAGAKHASPKHKRKAVL